MLSTRAQCGRLHVSMPSASALYDRLHIKMLGASGTCVRDRCIAIVCFRYSAPIEKLLLCCYRKLAQKDKVMVY